MTTVAIPRLQGQNRRVLEAKPAPDRPRKSWWPRSGLAAALFASVLLVPSLIWVCLDRSVWPWDQSWYGEVSVELYYTFRCAPGEWWKAMLAAFGIKAPGIAWLGQWFVPLGKRLGSIDLALHFSILVSQCITLVLVYKIGRRITPQRGLISLVGCTLVAAAPLFVGMSHQYLTEPLQTMAVAWIFYVAIASPRWSRTQTLAQLCAAGSVAMLAKASSPSYCLLPGLMAAATLWRGRTVVAAPSRWRFGIHCGFFLLSLLLLAGTSAWYWKNGTLVRTNAYECSLGWVSLNYGHKDTFLNKFAFWMASVREGLFIPYTYHAMVLLTLVGVGGAAFHRCRTGVPLCTQINLLAVVALVHVLLVLSMASLAIPEETRYIVPLLPALAILAMWSLAQVHSRVLAMAFLGLVLFQWGWVHGITLGGCQRAFNVWLIPLQCDPTRAKQIEELVVRTSNDTAAKGRYNMVGVELPWLNFNTLNYLSAQNKLKTNHRTYFTGLGYAETDPAKALERLEQFNVVYYISLDRVGAVDFLNQVSQPVTEAVAQDPRYVRQPDPTSSGIVLFRRGP